MSDDLLPYEHTQPGLLMLAVMAGALALVLSTLWVLPAGQRWLIWPSVLVVGGVAVLFHGLTVRVADGTLTWYFGPHFWTNEIAVDAIARAEPVRNSALMGWGIRRLRDGWLYNVSGLDAVEVETRDGTTVRIGTDEPEALCRALAQARDAA
jgi:hypothetical protein